MSYIPVSSIHRPSETHGGLAFADVFVIGTTTFVWGLISIYAAVYYTKLLRHDACRRWPILRYDRRKRHFMLLTISLFTFICWPGIAAWDFSARFCDPKKPWAIYCESCRPFISDEAHAEEKERRLHAQLRYQQMLIVGTQPQIATKMQAVPQRAVSMNEGVPFNSTTELVRAKEEEALTRPPSAVLPPPHGTGTGR